MGGNLAIRGYEATRLDLTKTSRSGIVPVLNKLLYAIDAEFTRKHGKPLWNHELLTSQQFLSGSSLQFFNLSGISDTAFVSKKSTVGDMDTMINKEYENDLRELLTDFLDRKIGPAILRGFQRGNEQFSSLWELPKQNLTIQIDFEFVEFTNDAPTEWAKFSHSSAWEDLAAGVKGVFHKWLIQAFATLSRREFYLRKMTGRGKARTEQDVLTIDNMYSFAVSSREGGGLRAKYEPVVDAATGKSEVKDGKPVMRALPASGYQQDVNKIFATLLNGKIPSENISKLRKKFWSFVGLVDIMRMLDSADQQRILEGFLQKTIGPGSQGLYKNDPDKDISEKLTAINYLLRSTGLPKPANFDQMMQEYRNSYKMSTDDSSDEPTKSDSIVKGMAKNTLAESTDFKRKGIPHIYNPGSSVEIKDAEFIELCKEISANGGNLDNTPVNLKVDGAGIRFGKDQSGRPFFMTSRVTEPKYIENFGDFTRYGRKMQQSPEKLEMTSKYDLALKLIVTANFMKVIPEDTIVQAEMLFVPLAKQEDGGLKFVNIAYDPKKLGSIMTIVPFAVAEYSTGTPKNDADGIKQKLVQASTPSIKIVNNQLSQRGINVSSVVDPVAKNADSLLAAIKARSSSDAKTKAKTVLSVAKKNLSDAIMHSSQISGKDQLGNTIEGLVINLPSGKKVKITSSSMQDVMRQKVSESAMNTRHKPAVVTVGSFVGHLGHQQLIDQTIAIAKKAGGDPYIYVSPSVGPDDPIPPSVKLKTLQILYPEYKNNIQVWNSEGTAMKKIEKELVLPKESPYNKIILVVGTDRYDGFKKWMDSLENRMKNPQAVAKFGGTQNQVEFETVKSDRDKKNGGTGISFTMLRNIIKDPQASNSEKLNMWTKSFDTSKLGVDWIKNLMSITEKNMKAQTIKEYIDQIKPLLNEATSEQKQRMMNVLFRAKTLIESVGTEVKNTSELGGVEHAYFDPETHDILAYAKHHYPEEPDLQAAFVKFVLRSLKHSREDDERQDNEIDLLMKRVNSLQDKINNVNNDKNLDEGRDYLEEK